LTLNLGSNERVWCKYWTVIMYEKHSLKIKYKILCRTFNHVQKAKYLAWQHLGFILIFSWLHFQTNSLCKPKPEWIWSCVDLLWLNTLEGYSFLHCSRLLLQLHWLQSLTWKHSPERVLKPLVHWTLHFLGWCLGAISDCVQ